jgi:hypothetical protein
MSRAEDLRADPRRNAEFFPQFARKCVFERLALFPFAARELPHQLKPRAAPPLAHQQLSIRLNERCDHTQQ